MLISHNTKLMNGWLLMLEMTDDIIEVQEDKQANDNENKWCVYVHVNMLMDYM